MLATHLRDINVTVVDINQHRIDAWNSNRLPISEPGLDDLVELGRSLECSISPSDNDQPITAPSTPHGERKSFLEAGFKSAKLRFTTDVDTSIRKADLIFVCVDTPSAPADNLLGNVLDTRTLLKAVRRVGEVAVKDFILVEKCTVPCGTAKEIERTLQETLRPGIQFEVLSNPEFLAEGTAIADLLNPSRVLVGSFATNRGMRAATTLAALYEQWVPKDKIFTIDTWSSELAKVAANALLSQRISSINSLSMICENTNADIRTVSKACALDHRIGPHMLNSSVGFGGSCFHKDVSYLVYLAASLGLDQVARYWQAVLDMNDYQQTRFGDRVARRLGGTRADETKVAVLGFAFKAKTNDIRNSAAIRVVKDLIQQGFEIAIYDPCVEDADIWDAISDASRSRPSRVSICASSQEACYRANAVVILTECDEFRYPSASKANKSVFFDSCPPTPESLDRSDTLSLDAMDYDLAGEKRSHGLGLLPDADEKANCSGEILAKEKHSRIFQKRVSEELKWDQVAKQMLEPKQIFDGRNIIADNIVDLGFRVERIGKMSGSL